MNKPICFLLAMLACQAAPFLPAQETTASPAEKSPEKPGVQEPKSEAQPAPNKESDSAGEARREDRVQGRRSRGSREVGKQHPPFLSRFAEAVEPAAKCTVRILADGKAAALGTIVSAQGHVFTKASETDGGKMLTCRLHDGSVHSAELVATSASFDVALLKIEAGKLGVPEWKNATDLPAGTFAAAPDAGEQVIAFGVLSLPLRDFSQADRGYLGVRAGNAAGGALIESVEPGTAASDSGLKAKDIIQSINETKIGNSSALIRFLRTAKPRQQVTLGLSRDGEVSTMEVVLGSYVRAGGRTPRLSRNDRLGGPLSKDAWGYPTALQHDLILAPNQCGGPLVTLDGKVIGINIARSSRIRTFAIPSEAVVALMMELGVPSASSVADAAALKEARKNLETLKMQREAAESAARKARQAYQAAEEQLRKLQEKPE